MAALSFPIAVTGPALPHAPLRHMGICFVIRVAARALRPITLVLAGYPTPDVFSHRDWVQMTGSNAMSNSAQMIQNQPSGDWPDQHFVGQSVDSDVPIKIAYLGVAGRLQRTSPNPTWSKIRSALRHRPILVDPEPQSDIGWNTGVRHKDMVTA